MLALRLQTVVAFALAMAALDPANKAVANKALADNPLDRAFSGAPLGVGVAKFRFAKVVRVVPDGRAFEVTESNGRLLYPAFTTNGDDVLADTVKAIQQLEVRFLFLGTQPLKVKLVTNTGETFVKTITPVTDAMQHKTELKDWWMRYTRDVQHLCRDRRYSSMTDRFLVTMLAQRIGQKVPKLSGGWDNLRSIDQSFGMLVGTESIRAAMQQDTLLRKTNRIEKPTFPLPKAVTPPAIVIPPVPDDVKIEAIALRVPEDCFYIRCGSFSNFLWLKKNVVKWGSQARNLIYTSGIDYAISERLERQLALKESVLSRLFGDSVIGDVAIVGADPFIREGSSLGVLFAAKKNDVLRAQIHAQRSDAKDRLPAAQTSTIKLEGQQVAVLQSPDNQVRSFYAVHGDYHFVSNSRELVRSFLLAAGGGASLGKLAEFRHARTLMPLDRADTAFIYLSDLFFRRMVGPGFRVEMTRRMQALSDIELTELAVVAAKAEGRPHATIDSLINSGILPIDFQTRSDGSRTVIENGVVTDSMRGGRGTFIPIADVPIHKITRGELTEYQRFSQMYRRLWERMDPVAIGVQRHPLGDSKERLSFDIHVTPYPRQLFGFLPQLLAKPNHQMLEAVKGDIATAEVNFSRMALAFVATEQQDFSHVFAGLRDMSVEFTIKNGHVTPMPGPDLSAYLGASPPVLLNKEETTKPDEAGYARVHTARFLFGKDEWIRQWDKFRVRSGSKEILQAVTPSLRLIRAERPAQIRARVSDLGQSQYGKVINAMGYIESRHTSAANARLVHRVSDQFGMAPSNARKTCESLLQGKLICPLGGEYQSVSRADRPEWFESTAWNDQSLMDITSVPKEYHFPFLEWFNGLYIEFSIDATTLTTRVEVELETE